MRTGSSLALAAGMIVATVGGAADWPQWRGPDRSGVSAETGLLKSWPKAGPPLLWTFSKAGRGYSSPAVVGGKAYLLGARDDEEYLIGLDDKGADLWATKIGPVFDFRTNQWSRGPNSTPSLDGGLVYGLGSQGILICAEANGGKEVWRKDLPRDMAGEVSNYAPGGVDKYGWGYCWSPLVDGEKLLIVPGGPGGLFAALDKKTGKELWRSKGVPEQATYSSPMVLEVGGVRHYVYVTQNGVLGVDAKNGDLLWSYKRAEPFPDVVCPTPIVRGDQVYVTAWGGGAELLKVTPAGKGFDIKVVWSEREIANHHGGVVLVDQYVYGFDGERAWKCQEFASGQIKWTSMRGALGPGSLMAADGMLFCLSEKGGKGLVALLEATPQKYTEKARFSLPQGAADRKTLGHVWTHPVLSDGKLYLRDQEYLFCYQVK
jgi:outer membrane protein assembly factor BamB